MAHQKYENPKSLYEEISNRAGAIIVGLGGDIKLDHDSNACFGVLTSNALAKDLKNTADVMARLQDCMGEYKVRSGAADKAIEILANKAVLQLLKSKGVKRVNPHFFVAFSAPASRGNGVELEGKIQKNIENILNGKDASNEAKLLREIRYTVAHPTEEELAVQARNQKVAKFFRQETPEDLCHSIFSKAQFLRKKANPWLAPQVELKSCFSSGGRTTVTVFS